MITIRRKESGEEVNCETPQEAVSIIRFWGLDCRMAIEVKLAKKNMALFIVSVLFNNREFITESHPMVKKKMKLKKGGLQYEYRLALRAMASRK